jgi:hypothetical protein
MQVSETDGTKAPASKLKRSAIEKSLQRKKTAKLKLSGWYNEAARSVGISSKKPPRKCDEARE